MQFNGASPYSQNIAIVMSETNQVRKYYFTFILIVSFQSCLDLTSDIRTNILYVFITDLTLGDQ
jgi:hypothetical protein